jgi:hypothetical protein
MNTDPKNDHNLADANPAIIADFKQKIETWKMARVQK